MWILAAVGYGSLIFLAAIVLFRSFWGKHRSFYISMTSLMILGAFAAGAQSRLLLAVYKVIAAEPYISSKHVICVEDFMNKV